MTETLRDGRYVVTRPLGVGSQGTTLEAVDKREGRLVAVKRFEVKNARRWKDVELAEREARVLASLSHPMLPAYNEHFEENGALYLVMERIEGASLAEHRKAGGTFAADDAIALLEHASVMLDYLHARTPPIIHRDLKPGNVIRRPDKSFGFVDFGAVRDKLRLEGGSTIVGTFGYMAPEQFQGRALPASDVYAIGATTLWMLTGVEPEDLPHKGLAVDVQTALGARARPELVAVLAQMLEPDPEKRPRRIAPLLARLHSAPPRPRVTAPPAAAMPSPAAAPFAHVAPSEDHIPTLLRYVRRTMPLLWVLSALAWWWLPFRTSMSFTIGLVVLSVVTRSYLPRPERPARRARRNDPVRIRVPGAAVRVESERTPLDPHEEEARAEAEWRAREEEDARRQRDGR